MWHSIFSCITWWNFSFPKINKEVCQLFSVSLKWIMHHSKGSVFCLFLAPKWLGPLKEFLEVSHFCKVGIIFWQHNLRADGNFSRCLSLTFWMFAPCYRRWDRQHNINLIFQWRSKHLKACEGWMTPSQSYNTTQRVISYFQLHLWSNLRRYFILDLLVWGWADSKRGTQVLQHSTWKMLQGP